MDLSGFNSFRIKTKITNSFLNNIFFGYIYKKIILFFVFFSLGLNTYPENESNYDKNLNINLTKIDNKSNSKIFSHFSVFENTENKLIWDKYKVEILGFCLFIVFETLLLVKLLVSTIRNKRYKGIVEADGKRLHYSIELSGKEDMEISKMLEFSLNACLDIVDSKIGYFVLCDENSNETNFYMMIERIDGNYKLIEKEKTIHIEKHEILTEVFRQKKPIVRNDIRKNKQEIIGNRIFNINLNTMLSVPINEKNKIVAICGVINKNKSKRYNKTDVEQLIYFAHGAWNIISRKESEDFLKKALSEKEVLIKELYHRTKNNMQVISAFLQLQSIKSNSENISNIVKETIAKIQTMSLVHEKLYKSKNLSKIDLGEYLIDLEHTIKHYYSGNNINIKTKFFLEKFDSLIDIILPCGLIVNELLSNIYKYAFFGDKNEETIIIKLEKDDMDMVTLIVSDNGIGLKSDIDLREIESLGLQTVFNIAENQLQGNIEYVNDNGITWKIRFNNNLYNVRV